VKKLFNKKIPTILGIILILLGIFLTTFILKNQTTFKSKALNSQEPQNVKITNITDASFTVTYQTDAQATGSISYGDDKKLGESELEDVDKEKKSFSPKKIHSVSIKKLIPSTKYYLTVISGSSTFLNNGSPFEITTGPDISSASAKSDLASAQQNIIKGKIVLPDGNAPSEALVYLNAENSQLLSSTVTKDGEFSFLLKDLRTDDLFSYFNIDNNTVFKIFATDGSLKSTALASLNQANTIPTITLSNDYDFAQKVSPVASKTAELSSGFPSIIPLKEKPKLEIINPKENQSFADLKPQFRGTSLPNEKVEIIIHSDEQITAQVTADSNGNWTYKPSVNLSPGAHTITIKTRDSSGILTTIMQPFTVFAAETQASGFATPSATPTVIPAQRITPTLTLTPTIAMLIPAVSPTPTFIFIPAGSNQELPPTGDSRIIFVTIITAIATTAAGVVLFLLTRILPL